ncbi:MAG: hypothetical protein WC781_04330 [Candidatus Pacearchaeota archaeon]|jgi:hypothetical protein
MNGKKRENKLILRIGLILLIILSVVIILNSSGKISLSPATSCIYDSGCLEKQTCYNSYCRAEKTCTGNNNCLTGQVCDGGYCKTSECYQSSECVSSPFKTCSNSLCKLQSCVSDFNCPSGTICRTGLCVKSQCKSDFECGSNMKGVCYQGICLPKECSANTNCGTGSVCDNGLCSTIECDSDSQCSTGELCLNNLCKKPECTQDSSCKGLICEGYKCITKTCLNENDKSCGSNRWCQKVGTSYQCMSPLCINDLSCPNGFKCDGKFCTKREAGTCSRASECGSQTTSLSCVNNNLIRITLSPACTNNLCVKTSSQETLRQCGSTMTCSAGSCVGASTSYTRCESGNIVRITTINVCATVCSTQTTQIISQYCSYGCAINQMGIPACTAKTTNTRCVNNWQCQSGSCVGGYCK